MITTRGPVGSMRLPHLPRFAAQHLVLLPLLPLYPWSSAGFRAPESLDLEARWGEMGGERVDESFWKVFLFFFFYHVLVPKDLIAQVPRLTRKKFLPGVLVVR